MSQAVATAYRRHERLVWGIGYRMLGTTADADEVLQETFTRALEHRPDDERPLRPWLVRVAANLARDRLRKRRRRAYTGPWLPSPLDTSAEAPVGWIRPAPAPDPEDRVDLVRTVSYAWMAAAEALTPNQRAVLVLRDVLELDTAETAAALGLSPSNVKVTLHRARRALGAVDAPLTGSGGADALALVARLGAALAAGDVDAVKAVLTEDIVATSDGGGVYRAALRPVLGRDRVTRLYLGLAAQHPEARVTLRLISGHPALLVHTDPRGRDAPFSVLLFGVRDGRIDRVWSVLAPDKLETGSSPQNGVS